MIVKIVKLSDPQRVWQASGSSIGLSGNKILAADEELVNDAIKVGTLIQMWEGDQDDITDELIAQLSKTHGIPSKPKPVEAVALPTDVIELQALVDTANEDAAKAQASSELLEGEVSDLKLQLGNSEKAVSNLQSQLEEAAILESALKDANAQLVTEVEEGKRAVNRLTLELEGYKLTASKATEVPATKAKAAAVPPLPKTEPDA